MDQRIAPKQVPLSTLLGELAVFKEEWLKSPFSNQLRGLLLVRSVWNIDRAVVVGLGNMTPLLDYDDDENEYRRRRKQRLTQLTIFLDIVDILSTAQGGRQIKIYASDPAFERIDKAFLKKLGIKVVKEAEEHVTSSTFVYSPFCPWYVGVAAIRHSPQLYLGVSIQLIMDLHEPRQEPQYGFDMTEEQAATTEKFLQTRVMQSFPGLEHYPDSEEGMQWAEFKKLAPELVALTSQALWGAFSFYWPKSGPLPPVTTED
ncbi:hypothetical protein BU16DRAFT_581236 [Lophium mytilinum]|uniref:SRR1-like domain-containing protein n=1 Tax=Lophium mytilinum TaxID=390894 RepID=A0A6A6QXV0_9PEZI|nr:hypothetical protein BU16DRAFT_581236 [Lophium mytilinum]